MNRRSVWCLAGFRASRGIAAGMINVAFPYLVLRQVHQTALVLGFLYTAGAIGTAIIGLVVGFLADLWGRKAVLAVVGALLPVSALLVYLSARPWTLFLAAFLGGFSATGSLAGGGVGGAAQPVQNAVLADVTGPADRTAWFSRFAFLSGVTAALGAFAAGAVPVRPAFLVAGCVAAAGTLLIPPISVSRSAPPRRRPCSLRLVSSGSTASCRASW